MSETHLLIGNKEYILANNAGERLGYTKEYMLMLAKQGKIDGQKVGNKWYVFFPSVEEYFTQARREAEIRRHKLSESRKIELRNNLQRETGLVAQRGKIDSDAQFSRQPSLRHARIAFLETLVVVFLGISVGSLGYVGYSIPASASQSEGGFLNYIAKVVYEFFTPDVDDYAPHASRTNIQSQQDVSRYEVSTYVGTTTHTSVVLAPDDIFTSTTSTTIQHSFSDEVEVVVDDKNPNTGVIIPKFVDGDGEAYRFMMVPVNTQTQ